MVPKLTIFLLISAGIDFTAVPNITFDITFSPFPYTYHLLDDLSVEPSETFHFVLSVRAGVAASIAPASSIATVTITDNDGMLCHQVMLTSRAYLATKRGSSEVQAIGFLCLSEVCPV